MRALALFAAGLSLVLEIIGLWLVSQAFSASNLLSTIASIGQFSSGLLLVGIGAILNSVAMIVCIVT